MNSILLVHGYREVRRDLREALGQRYRLREASLGEAGLHLVHQPGLVVVDAPMETREEAQALRQALALLPSLRIPSIFLIDDLSRASIVRAHAFGAERVLPRPLNPGSLRESIEMLLARSRSGAWSQAYGAAAEGLEAGTEALERIFAFGNDIARLTQRDLFLNSESMIESLAECGLGQWVEAVKVHHSQTFRHSLLVTGIAIGFGQSLGVRREDLQRLSLGGLLHDVGKAAIPVEILEKPDVLTPEEQRIMQEHPGIGRTILTRQGGFAPEMIDIVAHHHECLDGSGYPDGLTGDRITDIVRIVTIADIFAALIEKRSYKPSLPNPEAYRLLLDMGPKLDQALVRAFEPVALQARLAA